MSDPHLHPVGSGRMEKRKQCPPFYQLEPKTTNDKYSTLTKMINMFHIFHQANTTKSQRRLRFHTELPYVSPSSSPHILHTFIVLMTLKGEFFSLDPLPSEIIRSICLQGWICFFTAGPNCKHPWRNYIKKHPVLNNRRKLGAGKQRRAPQHHLAFSYYKSLCGVQNLFLMRSARTSFCSWWWNISC